MFKVKKFNTVLSKILVIVMIIELIVTNINIGMITYASENNTQNDNINENYNIASASEATNINEDYKETTSNSTEIEPDNETNNINNETNNINNVIDGKSVSLYKDEYIKATPSEATPSEATPSEATPSEATPSVANKKFKFEPVSPEEDEIPLYYKIEQTLRINGEIAYIFKFEDRFEKIQYRVYGYDYNGIDFPLWYECDKNGIIKMTRNTDEYEEFLEEQKPIEVNLDEEYYNTAPYIWKSIDTNEEAWSTFPESEYYDIKSKEQIYFSNWDNSRYSIWHLTLKYKQEEYQSSKETLDEQINFEDANTDFNSDNNSDSDNYESEDIEVYYLYGLAENVKTNSNPEWKIADENGKILNQNYKFMNAMLYAYGGLAPYIDDLYFRENLPKRYNPDTLNPYNTSINPKSWIALRWTPGLDDITEPSTGVTYSFLGWNDRANKFIDISKRSRMTWEQTLFIPGGELFGVWKYSDKHLLKLNLDYIEESKWGGEEVIRPYENIRVTNETPGTTVKLYRPPNNFRNDGLIFQDWYSEKNGAGTRYGDTIDLNGTGTTTLYAKWGEKVNHKVRFLQPDGSLIKEIYVLTGDNASTPIQSEMNIPEGYYLYGWDKSLIDIRSDMDFTAKYEKLINLTFDAGEDGSVFGDNTYKIAVKPGVLSSVGVNLNDIISNTKKVGKTCSNYTFNGTNITSSFKVTEDTTFSAVYTKNYSSVKFIINNPAVTSYLYTTTYINQLDPLNFSYSYWTSYFPQYKGYTFIGWCESELGPDYGRIFNIGDIVPVDIAKELYGYWTTEDVTWNIDYGPLDGNIEFPKEIKTNTSVSDRTIAINNLPKYADLPQELNGYQLPSYSETWKNITGNYNFGEGTTEANSKFPSEKVINIKWNANPKQIRFQPKYPNTNNVGFRTVSGKGTTSDSQTYYGQKISDYDYSKLWDETLIPSGTKFIGWYDNDPSNGGKIVNLDDYITPKSTTSRSYSYTYADMYMVCAKNSSKITFKDSDGKIISEQIVNYGEHATIPTTSKYGYEFDGWDTPVDENSIFLNDTVFTAKYKQFDDAIYVYSNGGKFNDGDTNLFKFIRLDKSNPSEAIEKANTFLNEQRTNISKDGQGFYGWQVSTTSGVDIGSIKESDLDSLPKNLYALWKYQFTITFKDSSGNILDNKVVAKYDNASLIAPEPPIRDGYAFIGWSPSITYITSNVTTVAQYAKTWNLTIDAMGGEIYGNSTWSNAVRSDLAVYGQLDFTDIKNNIKKTAHKFSNLYMDPEFKTAFTTTTKISKDTTIYAKYDRNQTYVSLYNNLPGTSSGDTIASVYFYHLLKFGDTTNTSAFGNIYQKGWKMVGYAENRDGTGRVFTKDDLVPEDVPKALYRIWERYDVKYYINYGPNENSSLPTQIEAPSYIDGKTLSKNYLPNTESFPKYVKGHVMPKNNSETWMVGKDFQYPNYSSEVFGETSTEGSWYPNSDEVYITWNCQPAFINFVNLYTPNSLGVYTNRKVIGNDVKNYPRYGQYLNTSDLNAMVTSYNYYIPTGTIVHGLYNGDPTKNGEPIDLTKPLTPNAIIASTESKINVDLYLVFANSKSKITFKDWDGEVLSEQTVNYGDSITIPNAKNNKDGSVFVGWDYPNLNTDTKFPNDTVINAIYEETGFKINLHGNNGKFNVTNESGVTNEFSDRTLKFDDLSNLDSIIYESNKFLIDESKNLKRAGYRFNGWYTDPVNGDLVDSVNLNDITKYRLDLYARWKKTYDVTFKNISTVIEVKTVDEGNDVEFPADPKHPSNAKMIFSGWDNAGKNITYNRTISANYVEAYQITFYDNLPLSSGWASVKTDYYAGESNRKYGQSPFPSLDTSYWSRPENQKYFDIPEPKSDDAIFLGWGDSSMALSTNLVNWKWSKAQLLDKSVYNPKMDNVYGSGKVLPGVPIISGGRSIQVKNFINNYNLYAISFYGIWIPKDRQSLTLVNGFMDLKSSWIDKPAEDSQYINNIENNVPFFESISIANNDNEKLSDAYKGSSIDSQLGLPESMLNLKYHSSFRNSNYLVGYFSEMGGKGKKLDLDYEFNKVDDRYYAYWIKKDTTFNVTYKDSDGTQIGSTQQILVGNKSTQPEIPLKTGYTFTGWELVEGRDSTPDVIIGDSVFQAKYKQDYIPYTLTLDANGGWFNGNESKNQISMEVSQNTSLNPILYDNTENMPSMQYSDFAGWYTSPENTESSELLSKEIDNKMPSNNVTYYAHWSANKFKVSYVDYTGKVVYSEMVSPGTTNPTPPNNIEIDSPVGYNFSQWEKVSNINSDITIKAVYIKNSYTITFEDWDGITLKSEQVAYGENATPPSNPTRVGYNFKKWIGNYTDVSANTTITPEYKAIVYYIYYNGNGATSGNMAFNLPDYDQIQTLFNCDYKKIGYKFTKWNTKSDGTGIYYEEGQQVKNLTSVAGGRVDLYAQWEKSAGKVTFLDYDGKVLQSQDVNYGTTANAPSNPTRNGYTFNGWDNPESLVNIQGDVTVTATYVKNNYTVTLYGNDGSVDGSDYKNIAVEYLESLDSILSNYKQLTTRVGYEFSGWYTQSVNGTKYPESGNIMSSSNVSIYAQWIINKYKVSYLDSVGNVIKTEYVEHGSNSNIPEVNPTKDGHTFIGWDKSNLNIQRDTTISPVYSKNDYTVTFKDYDGTVLKNEQVAYGGNATPPSNPDRTGYIFSGWDKTFNNVQDNTVIYPVYNVNSYNISIYNESKLIKTSSVAYGSSIDSILNDAKDILDKPLYTFSGWFNQSVGGVKYNVSGNTMPASDINVYAQWIKSSSIVKYIDWNDTVLKTEAVVNGSNSTPPVNPSRVGYIFNGWDKSSSNIIDDTDINATYIPIEYTIEYKGNTNSDGNMVDSQHTYGQSKRLNKNEFIRENYRFTGWNTKADGSGDGYRDEESVINLTTENGDKVSLYAQWIKSAGRVRFLDYNGEILDEQYVTYGSTVTPPTNPVRLGYKFNGWDKPSLLINIQEDITVTATYVKNKYSVTFIGNGGLVDGETYKSIDAEYQSSLDNLMLDYKQLTARVGYKFNGWYSDSVNGTKYLESGNIMSAGNISIYAHWIKNNYKVRYVDYDETILKTENIEYGNDSTIPESNPSRVGYTFVGWDKSNKNIQNDIDINAIYIKNNYTVTFKDYDETILKSEQVSYLDNSTPPSNPSRVGYNFIGWDKDYNSVESDITINAMYSKKNYTVTFKDYNGTVLKSDNVAYGDSAIPPSSPIRVGYKFIGWDATYTNISHNIDITATYSKNSYRLSLKDYKGNLVSETSIAYGDSIYDILYNPDLIKGLEEPMYEFKGWFENPNSESEVGGRYNNINSSIMPDSNLTLYAHHIKNSFYVVFKDWDGTVLKTEVVLNGTNANPPSTLVRDGYSFNSWDKPSGYINITNDIELIAIYTPNIYTIAYNGNGNTSGNVEPSIHTYDKWLDLNNNLYVKDGYEFVNWNTKADGSGQVYLNNQSVLNLANNKNDIVLLYAQWSKSVYTINLKFIDNGILVENREIQSGKEIGSLPYESNYKNNFRFIGWYTNISGDGLLYNGDPTPSDIYKISPTTVFETPGSKTAYAVYQLDFRIIDDDKNSNNGTNQRPGKDGVYGTDDDEYYKPGEDGKHGTKDDIYIEPEKPSEPDKDNSNNSGSDKGSEISKPEPPINPVTPEVPVNPVVPEVPVNPVVPEVPVNPVVPEEIVIPDTENGNNTNIDIEPNNNNNNDSSDNKIEYQESKIRTKKFGDISTAISYTSNNVESIENLASSSITNSNYESKIESRVDKPEARKSKLDIKELKITAKEFVNKLESLIKVVKNSNLIILLWILATIFILYQVSKRKGKKERGSQKKGKKLE